MFDESFQLDATPRRSQRKIELPPVEKKRQTVLFAGLDCLPGQLNLFETDGQNEAEPTR